MNKRMIITALSVGIAQLACLADGDKGTLCGCLTDGSARTSQQLSTASPTTDEEDTALREWAAGKTVSQEAVRRFGEARCFASEPIPDGVFKRMQGKSYKQNCTVARTELRYVRVLHYNNEGQVRIGELVCHKSIAADLVDIFRTLFNAKYPIERMELIDNYGAEDEPSMEANNTSCFNFRQIAGSKKLSNHSQGKAIDINPLYNPYVKKRTDGTLIVSPQGGKPYANRSKRHIYKIKKNDLCYKEFIKHGFTWGGNWKSLKDYQHFEKQ